LVSTCYGQDEDGGSCRPDIQVPSAEICFANSGEDEDIQIEKGKKIASLPALGQEWTITFDLELSELPEDKKWMGILLVTDSAGDPKSFSKAGSRSPGVFFQGSSKTTLIKNFIGDTDKSLDIKDLLAKDEPTSFKISQEMEDGKLMYKIEIGGEEKLSEEQTGAFEGAVDVYAGSASHPPVPGVLKNFKLVLKGAAAEEK